MYFLHFELFATPRPPPVVKKKGPQVSFQPLLSITKVLQEQQTQYKYNTFTGPTLTNYSPRKSLDGEISRSRCSSPSKHSLAFAAASSKDMHRPTILPPRKRQTPNFWCS